MSNYITIHVNASQVTAPVAYDYPTSSEKRERGRGGFMRKRDLMDCLLYNALIKQKNVLQNSKGGRRLSFSHFSQSSDGRSDSGGSSGGDSVSTTSDSLLTRRTSPDTGSTSLDGLLTTERAVVSSVLLNFQLLDLSSQGGTVTDTVLTSDTNLLSSLSPVIKKNC